MAKIKPAKISPVPVQPWWEKNVVWGTSGLFGAPVMTALAVIFDIRWLLWGAWPFGFVALYSAFTPHRDRWRLLAFLPCCAVMTYSLYWIGTKIPPSDLALSSEAKEEFTNVLRTAIAAPDYTIVSCPAADERTCMYAAQFIPLFQRAGWRVEGPQVERATIGRPTDGVMIVNNGPPLADPQDPDHGVWTPIAPWTQPVKTALMMIGIQPVTQNDTALSKMKVRVYFGSIPKVRQ